MDQQNFSAMVAEALDNWDFSADENGVEVKAGLEYIQQADPERMKEVFEVNYAGMHPDRWESLNEMALNFGRS